MNRTKVNWLDSNSLQAGARRIGIRNIGLGLAKRGVPIRLAVFALTGWNYPVAGK